MGSPMDAEDQLALPLPADPGSVVADVRDFLRGLKADLPLLFPARSRRVRKVPFRGGMLDFRVDVDSEARYSRFQESEEGLLLIRSPNDPAKPREILNEWYRGKASALFSERTALWAARMGLAYRSVRIKDQRTLWGSCSKEGNLNFNWRVVLAPPEALDYLVIHELAHLREMNHSRRFWALVAAQCPGWKAQRRWLREHSRELKKA
ncbi:MAG: M48 family metallopeptidase [Elusimicrobia bacterium]|nr:M48 family metallopeptidase [Elusimicrobiota bacterium]